MLLLLLACDGGEPATPPAAPEPPPAAPEAPAPAKPAEPTTDASGNTVCPDGRTVFPFWAGEYPHPILQINTPVPFKVAEAPCVAPTRDCTVSAGLYHPWAPNTPAMVQFASRTAPQVHVAKEGATIDGNPIAPGTEVTVVTYLAEGMCSMTISGSATEGMCPGTESDDWTEKPRTAPADDQILQVPCEDGTVGWIVVDETLKDRHPEIVDGEFVGYGEVKWSK